MKDREVILRYAEVLFDHDRDTGQIETRLEDFDAFIGLLFLEPKLRKFFLSPQFTFQEKKELLDKISEGKFDPSFLTYLIEKGRFKNLEAIADEYREKVEKRLGIWEVELTTATPIDEKEEETIKEKLEKTFHKGIRIEKIIDPKIVGGAILVIGNEMLDWSVTGRLRKLRETLLTGVP